MVDETLSVVTSTAPPHWRWPRFMDDLQELLTCVRQSCSRLPLHRHVARQLSLRATQTVLSGEDLAEEDVTNFVNRLRRPFEEFLRRSEPFARLDPLTSIVQQKDILSTVISLFEDIRLVLFHYEDLVAINVGKWTSELTKAQALDYIELCHAICDVSANPLQMLKVQSLSKPELQELVELFEAALEKMPDNTTLKDTILHLCSPRATSLVDMTDRIRLLGDKPMVFGYIADFWLAGTSSGNLVAAKVPRNLWEEDVDSGLMREAKISVQFAHPNVLPTYGTARVNGRVAAISPWMRNGNVIEYLRAHRAADRLQMCYEIAQGLQYMHSLGITHGNLRPVSILISEKGAAVISGFTFAHPAEDSPTRATDQPFSWSGIEAFPAEIAYRRSTKSSDVRYLGTLMYQLLVGQVVSKASLLYEERYFKQAIGGFDDFMPDSPMRNELIELVLECIQEEPERLTASQVVERLADLVTSQPPPSSETPQRLWPVPSAPDISLPDLSAEVRRIGSLPITGGGFCDIWLGQRLGKEKVALKILKMFGVPDQFRRRFLAEAAIWSQLKHENILEFYGICDHDTSISMVSPWLQNSNVVHYLNSINPSANRLKLVNDAAQGLLYLHSRNSPIIHGDIKCANILVQDDGTACLADFGLSRLHEEVTSLSLRDSGSHRFMAPELFDSWENDSVPTKTLASDCYALGQVIVELLSGQKPFFELAHDSLIFMAVTRGQRAKRPETELAKQWITDPVWSLVQWMTANARERRPSLQEVAPQLRALWVQSTSQTYAASTDSRDEESATTLAQSRSWADTKMVDQLSREFESLAAFGITFGEADPASTVDDAKGWDALWLEAKRG